MDTETSQETTAGTITPYTGAVVFGIYFAMEPIGLPNGLDVVWGRYHLQGWGSLKEKQVWEKKPRILLWTKLQDAFLYKFDSQNH